MPGFINMLSWWLWLILAAVPPAILALYFLKLKRRPLEVPSTYLWHKSIEDLHVNTIWQRLRRNLLLFLQLLLVLLIMIAVLRPGMEGSKLLGNRFIFLVDNSASMQASDLTDSRLAEAKLLAKRDIEKMQPGDVAMVVSFSNTPKVEQMFTEDKGALLRSVKAIKPTTRSTSLAEAIKVASGLANPGRSSSDATDVQVAEAKRPRSTSTATATFRKPIFLWATFSPSIRRSERSARRTWESRFSTFAATTRNPISFRLLHAWRITARPRPRFPWNSSWTAP